MIAVDSDVAETQPVIPGVFPVIEEKTVLSSNGPAQALSPASTVSDDNIRIIIEIDIP